MTGKNDDFFLSWKMEKKNVEKLEKNEKWEEKRSKNCFEFDENIDLNSNPRFKSKTPNCEMEITANGKNASRACIDTEFTYVI